MVKLAAVFLLSALLAVGCGTEAPTGEAASPGQPSPTTAGPAASDGASSPKATSTSPGTSSPAQAKGIVVTTRDSDFGSVLFDASGQAIYIWEVEASEKPECYGDCAHAWPPVVTDGPPVAQGEVNASLLGTTTRTDGATQVTYAGHPLYYYAHEGKNEVKCHNVSTHGGLWWVVTPAGSRAP